VTHAEALDLLKTVDSFPALLAAVHQARYTGALTISFYCGAPDTVEVPQQAVAPTRIPLGKRKRGLTPPPPIPHATG
jgi:hypothetical protein